MEEINKEKKEQSFHSRAKNTQNPKISNTKEATASPKNNPTTLPTKRMRQTNHFYPRRFRPNLWSVSNLLLVEM